MWARGQGWAIYGYTMVYRETGEEQYLDLAQKTAKAYQFIVKEVIATEDRQLDGEYTITNVLKTGTCKTRAQAKISGVRWAKRFRANN